jgi:hypothetical protein
VKVINLAVRHLGKGDMESSARASLAHARAQEQAGNLRIAWHFALRSIAYSVGIMHPDYAEAHQELYGPEAPVELHPFFDLPPVAPPATDPATDQVKADIKHLVDVCWEFESGWGCDSVEYAALLRLQAFVGYTTPWDQQRQSTVQPVAPQPRPTSQED